MRRTLILLCAVAAGCGVQPVTGLTDDSVQPLACQPSGIQQPPTDIYSDVLEVRRASISLVTEESDCTGMGESENWIANVCKSSVFVLLNPPESMEPSHTRLNVYVNGCLIGPYAQDGPGYHWGSQPDDPDFKVSADRFVVIEVEEEGSGVLIRRSFLLPSVLPQLLEPTAGSATGEPLQVRWSPLGLDSLQGAETTMLNVQAYHNPGGDGFGTDGSAELDDSRGSFMWEHTLARWTALSLDAAIFYESSDAEVSATIKHYIPVN